MFRYLITRLYRYMDRSSNLPGPKREQFLILPPGGHLKRDLVTKKCLRGLAGLQRVKMGRHVTGRNDKNSEQRIADSRTGTERDAVISSQEKE